MSSIRYFELAARGELTVEQAVDRMLAEDMQEQMARKPYWVPAFIWRALVGL